MAADLRVGERDDFSDSHVYTPQGNAKAVFESDAPEILLSGPAGTGKTRANLEYIHQQMLAYPGARCLIVRKTRHSLSQTVLVTYERDVLGEDNPICSNMQPEHRSKYIYPNGSVVVLGGMDKPTKILSSEYDIIYTPEATELTLTDWETLASRNRSFVIPIQRMIADTNPDSDQHWLLKRVDEGLLKIVHCHHEDNPILYNADTKEWTDKGKSYVFGTLERLTGVRYQRLRWGKWVQAEGAVYENYDSSIHLIDSFPIPERWRRIRVIDFGYTNPFVCDWWAIDPDGRMYLYRQIYMSNRTVAKHADEIHRLTAGFSKSEWREMDDQKRRSFWGRGERIEATIADWDAEDRATLTENGIRTIAAEKAITVGIEKTAERLEIAGDGKPRLFILRDALVEADELLIEKAFPACTAQEIGGYRYPPGVDGKPLKEIPIDEHNHGMDTMRYGVMYVDKGKTGMQKIGAKGLFKSAPVRKDVS